MKRDLEAITILCDGHHRLEAYHLSGKTSKPVTYFDGSVREADLASFKVNGITKLQMSQDKKVDVE